MKKVETIVEDFSLRLEVKAVAENLGVEVTEEMLDEAMEEVNYPPLKKWGLPGQYL